MKIDLSIIIVNYNTKELIDDCISSIIEQTAKVNYEIIVIDNNSQDGSVEFIKQKYKEVIVVDNDVNLGFSKANNIGVSMARGEYYLLLNSDTVVIDNALYKAWKFISDVNDIAVVNCKQYNKDGTHQISYFGFQTIETQFFEAIQLNKLFRNSSFFNRRFLKNVDHCSIIECDTVMGAFMLIPRNIYAEIKGLDEKYFMYYEETDFCFRAKKRGYKIIYYPFAEIIHLGGGSTTPGKKVMKISQKSQKYYFIKNYNYLYYFVFLFVLKITCLNNILLNLLLYPFNIDSRGKRKAFIKYQLELFFTFV